MDNVAEAHSAVETLINEAMADFTTVCKTHDAIVVLYTLMPIMASYLEILNIYHPDFERVMLDARQAARQSIIEAAGGMQ